MVNSIDGILIETEPTFIKYINYLSKKNQFNFIIENVSDTHIFITEEFKTKTGRIETIPYLQNEIEKMVSSAWFLERKKN